MHADTQSPPDHDPLPVRLLRMAEVCRVTGLSRSRVYAMESAGEFPRRRRLTERTSAWRSDEVAAWIEARPFAGADT